MNGINWTALYQNGNVVKQIQDNGNYTLFTQLNKQNIILFSVENSFNDVTYSINLKNGQFLINGIPINISINSSYKNIQLQNYTKNNINLFWYNDCQAIVGSNQSKINTCYFGYKIKTSIPYNYKDIIGEIIQFKLSASIQFGNNIFSMSQTKKIKTDKGVIAI